MTRPVEKNTFLHIEYSKEGGASGRAYVHEAVAITTETKSDPWQWGALSRVDPKEGKAYRVGSGTAAKIARLLRHAGFSKWVPDYWEDAGFLHAFEYRLRVTSPSFDGEVVYLGARPSGLARLLAQILDVVDDEGTALAPPRSGPNGACVQAARSYCAAFSPDLTLLATGRNGSVAVWDLKTGRAMSCWTVPKGQVTSLAFDADSERVASAHWFWGAEVRDPRTGKALARAWTRTQNAECVGFRPDGAVLVTGGTGGVLEVRDGAGAHSLRAIRVGDGAVSSLAFDPGGGTLAVGVGGYIGAPIVVLLHADSWQRKGALKARVVQGGSKIEHHPPPPACLGFSPDGRLLASGHSDWSVRLWLVRSGGELVKCKGHLNAVRGVALARGGGLLASASEDYTVRLWQVPSGRLHAVLRGHRDGVNALAFSHDGSRLFSAGRDRTVRTWNVRTGRVLATLVLSPQAATEDIGSRVLQQ